MLDKIEALPEVVSAVRGKIPVFIDGGIRRGSDVFKALALGAKAVFIGRPILYGLAYDGANGVKTVLNILREELVESMKLTGMAFTHFQRIQRNIEIFRSKNFQFFPLYQGCKNVKDISPAMVVHRLLIGMNLSSSTKSM